jgi:hypothetical protein
MACTWHMRPPSRQLQPLTCMTSVVCIVYVCMCVCVCCTCCKHFCHLSTWLKPSKHLLQALVAITCCRLLLQALVACCKHLLQVLVASTCCKHLLQAHMLPAHVVARLVARTCVTCLPWLKLSKHLLYRCSKDYKKSNQMHKRHTHTHTYVAYLQDVGLVFVFHTHMHTHMHSYIHLLPTCRTWAYCLSGRRNKTVFMLQSVFGHESMCVCVYICMYVCILLFVWSSW